MSQPLKALLTRGTNLANVRLGGGFKNMAFFKKKKAVVKEKESSPKIPTEKTAEKKSSETPPRLLTAEGWKRRRLK